MANPIADAWFESWARCHTEGDMSSRLPRGDVPQLEDRWATT